MESRKIASHFIYTPQGFLSKGMITLNGDGLITDISVPENLDTVPGLEFYGGIIVPGMVNCHCHLELSHLKGSIPSGSGFAGFAKGIREARGRFSLGDQIDAMDFQDSKMWNEGIIAVADISNGLLSFPVKSKSKISYQTFLEIFGLGTYDSSHIEQIKSQARKEYGIEAEITPHSVYSLNDSLFRQAISLNKSILSIHFMESPGESELFEGRGELTEWYKKTELKTDFTDKYSSPTDRIIKNITPEKRVMLIHNTFIREEDVEKLTEHFGNNVTFVLCPRSNNYITGNLPPVDLLLRKKVRVAVGTDSLASNKELSILNELKMFTGVTLTELINWVTRNGAEALGGNSYGSIEAGKKPGLALMENIDINTFKLTSESTAKRIV